MKKNQKQNTSSTTTTAEAAPVAPTTPAAEPQKQEPDFYARLLTERPNEAASIMATLNRRKDFALRQLSAHLKAGRDIHAALQHAMAIAFPKHSTQQAAP